MVSEFETCNGACNAAPPVMLCQVGVVILSIKGIPVVHGSLRWLLDVPVKVIVVAELETVTSQYVSVSVSV